MRSISVHPDILFFAVRYALPRQTGAVTRVCAQICRCAEELSEKDRAQMAKEVEEALCQGEIPACEQGEWETALYGLSKASKEAIA